MLQTAETYMFALPMKVRDYECDLQGIVNNANYQHYLEHARHEFMLGMGVSVSELHDRGVDFVVTHAEMDYKRPLHSRDEFVVKLNVHKKGIRWLFHEDIFMVNDASELLCLRSMVSCVAVVNGRPKDSPDLQRIFTEYFPDINLYE